MCSVVTVTSMVPPSSTAATSAIRGPMFARPYLHAQHQSVTCPAHHRHDVTRCGLTLAGILEWPARLIIGITSQVSGSCCCCQPYTGCRSLKPCIICET